VLAVTVEHLKKWGTKGVKARIRVARRQRGRQESTETFVPTSIYRMLVNMSCRTVCNVLIVLKLSPNLMTTSGAADSPALCALGAERKSGKGLQRRPATKGF
jgi:hypothetical protein